MKTAVVGPAEEQEAHLAALRIKHSAAQYRLYGGKLQRMDGGKWRPVCFHDARPERCKEGCGGSELCRHLLIERQCRTCHPLPEVPPTAEQQALLEALRGANPNAQYRLSRGKVQRLDAGKWKRVCFHDRRLDQCHECHTLSKETEDLSDGQDDSPQADSSAPSMTVTLTPSRVGQQRTASRKRTAACSIDGLSRRNLPPWQGGTRRASLWYSLEARLQA